MAKKQNGNGQHGNGRQQMFAITAPDAMSVQLVGDFTHWQSNPVSMHRESGGVWRAKVNLEPGSHHYRFLVDGQWRDDPDCQVEVANPFGGKNSVRRVN